MCSAFISSRSAIAFISVSVLLVYGFTAVSPAVCTLEVPNRGARRIGIPREVERRRVVTVHREAEDRHARRVMTDDQGARNLVVQQRVDVRVDLADLVRAVLTRNPDAVAVRLLHTDEVVAFVDGEDEQRVLLGDAVVREPLEERRKRIVVRLQLCDVSG